MAGAAFKLARPRDSLAAGGADHDVEEGPHAGGPRGRRARASRSHRDARGDRRRPVASGRRTDRWALSDRVTLNLTYERTAYAPMMPHDHDDGILTGLKLGF